MADPLEKSTVRAVITADTFHTGLSAIRVLADRLRLSIEVSTAD